ncbi:MAG: hypothetical protein AAGJ81_09695 [Verrucomicrobiota bacterium]
MSSVTESVGTGFQGSFADQVGTVEGSVLGAAALAAEPWRSQWIHFLSNADHGTSSTMPSRTLQGKATRMNNQARLRNGSGMRWI